MEKPIVTINKTFPYFLTFQCAALATLLGNGAQPTVQVWEKMFKKFVGFHMDGEVSYYRTLGNIYQALGLTSQPPKANHERAEKIAIFLLERYYPLAEETLAVSSW